MRYVATKDFQLKTPKGVVKITRGDELEFFNTEKAKVLQERKLISPVLDGTTSLALERKLNQWKCQDCEQYLDADGDQLCIVQGKRCFHLVNIERLRGCPRRNRRIRQAILDGRHRKWLH